jgi:predicted membrane GTPase involved in stress response
LNGLCTYVRRYTGDCLLDVIDSIPFPTRDVSKPLILPICDVISSRALGQLAVSGKLEAGAIRVNSKVRLLLLYVLFSILRHGLPECSFMLIYDALQRAWISQITQ